jgi:hypothetical protein
MSVSSGTYGVTQHYYGTSTNQGFFKTTSDTSLSFSMQAMGLIDNKFCAGVAQDPDEHYTTPPYWTSNSVFPFPGQVTTNTDVGDKVDDIDIWYITFGITGVTLLAGTIVPKYEGTVTNRWTDSAISTINTNDRVYTATATQCNTNVGTVRPVTASTDGGTVFYDYFQPRFDSVDYYFVTGQDTDSYGCAVAWDAGNQYI